jgi:hypothetical protein
MRNHVFIPAIYSSYLRPGDTVFVSGVGRFFFMTELAFYKSIESNKNPFYRVCDMAFLASNERVLRTNAVKLKTKEWCYQCSMRLIRAGGKMLLTERV